MEEINETIFEDFQTESKPVRLKDEPNPDNWNTSPMYGRLRQNISYLNLDPATETP
jgi:hypothetical protein